MSYVYRLSRSVRGTACCTRVSQTAWRPGVAQLCGYSSGFGGRVAARDASLLLPVCTTGILCIRGLFGSAMEGS